MEKLPEEIFYENQEWIIKEECETNPDYGKMPEDRGIEEKIRSGIVIIDKPYGPTSHQVSAWVRDMFNLKKAGHSGTLDPHVTGVLPIALEKGTKVLQSLKMCNKEYVGVMRLSKEVEYEKIVEMAEKFTGDVKQLPPKISAVKRRLRVRRIYYLKILEVNGNHILFKIGCEKGFYVRTFCEDFGRKLGVRGEMTDLRRTKVGLFNEEDSIYLQNLRDEWEFYRDGKKNNLNEIILPVEEGVKHLRKIVVKDSAINSLCHGSPLGSNGICRFNKGIKKGELIALTSLKGELIALAKSIMDWRNINKGKGIVAKVERVFMDRNTYPKIHQKYEG